MKPIVSLLKSLEDYRKIDPKSSFIIRLDGRCFSKYTRKLEKPFDSKMKEAMKDTTRDAVSEFGAVTGFTASDEITLIFNGETEHPYNGRIEKLTTLASAYVSVRFNFHMNTSDAIFDARLVVLSPESILLHQVWRSLYDTYRNTIGLYARQYYTSKQLNKKTTQMRIRMLEEVGVKVSDIPLDELWGTYLKREVVLKNEGCENECKRTIITSQSFRIENNAIYSSLLLGKYWDS